MPLPNLKDALQRTDDLVGVGEIARRYFAMNAFDGVVTIIGVLAGCWMAGVEEVRVVLVTGLTTAAAIAVSGFWGAYLTESAERARDIRELEAQTLTSLEGTSHARAARVAVWIVTAVDGLSPFLAAVLVLTPFLIPGWTDVIFERYATALGLALVVLFGIGLFLGRISRGSALVYGLKTLVAGVLAIAISLLLGRL